MHISKHDRCFEEKKKNRIHLFVSIYSFEIVGGLTYASGPITMTNDTKTMEIRIDFWSNYLRSNANRENQ